MEKILAPSTCPSCGEFLKWENHILYCRNVECGSQSQKKIEHFAKTLKIKGLGPAAIEKLELSNPGDLYFLTPSDIEEALGSKKLAEKLSNITELFSNVFIRRNNADSGTNTSINSTTTPREG